MEHLKSLNLRGTAIKELHSSIKFLPALKKIELEGCKRLSSIPSSICKLKYLEELNLSRCYELENFPEILEPMEYLKFLNLSETAVKELHSSIKFLPALRRIQLRACQRLSIMPKNICKLKYLVELDLSYCSQLENFPEFLELMEHLKSLNLSGTAVKKLPSSIEFLLGLKIIQLQGCKRLSSIPKNICKLKYLEELNLSCCFELENFPEILEPMEHLKYLNLSGTAVKELPLSIEFLPALTYIQLCGCKRLSSIPTSICKLKYLKELDLSYCSELESFPEILEPMELLKSLNLCGTTVKELPSSIEFLPGLKTIQLQGCKRLSSIPKSICKLKYLERLDLSWCFELENFPEILEPMEHLGSLNLSGRTVEELHSSIEFLPALKEIRLRDCKRLSSIPKSICKLKYLEELDLSCCSQLENFPENLEPMEHLKSLNLSGTIVTELHSLIKFLPVLKRIQLSGCERLSSIPKNICKLKYLEELDLSYCSQLENFPEILEPMEHLKSLNFSGTAVKELHSLIKFLPALKRIQLRGCERLSSIPKSICKLKYLEELDLSCCSELENFPEIMEPMEHLKFLNLSGTAVQELHSSIKFLPALRRIQLRACQSLSIMPKNICKLKYLVELDLSYCFQLENFPEFLELMEHLKSLNLSGTAVKKLPSSIEFLLGLKIIQLQGCKRLSSIPKNICKLKYLEELNLSCCSELENFPEILEPMEHLKSLNLSGTAVKELPLSIEFLPALTYIQLCGCKKLSSIPKSICKLKYLKELDLSYCSELESFPEIMEPMEHLKFLNLSGTAVQELHSSIEFLLALKEIQLQDCKRLSSIPKSICKLKYLEKLDLSCCSKLENFPEILEPMEHLKSLNLSETTVKELHSSIEFLPALKEIRLGDCKRLPSSQEQIDDLIKAYNYHTKHFSVGFLSLEKLNLSYSGILEIPNGLVCSTLFQCLSLSGTKIRSIAASIKQASRLSVLGLVGCQRLQFLPELPVLCTVKAHDCKLLKIVSSLRTALMLDEAHIRTMQVGTTAPSECHPWPLVIFVCAGKEIPNMFRYQNEGFSVNIKLRQIGFKQVESCGICPLYAEDAKKFKFDHVFMSREPKVEEEQDRMMIPKVVDQEMRMKPVDQVIESEANKSDDHGSKAIGAEDNSDFYSDNLKHHYPIELGKTLWQICTLIT
ncbi:hypothetical protein ACFX13_035977 [Malus domestica]